MATTAASFSPARISAATVTIGNNRSQKKETTKVVYIRGLNSYGGLKAHNSVASLGMPVCTEQGFANVINSLKASSNGKGKGGGALSSKCSKIGDIFQIAAILNGLTLLGVAVGFVLLRIEAFVEESAE
ncbi:uncharacterized protein [Euphorbia lathyris]|uniref:uncharacterized protein n=1 Tax=Euphorbia lathyris TaxID=212925 RepID=UPI0033134279